MKYILHGLFWIIYCAICFREFAIDFYIPMFAISLGFAFITMGLFDLYTFIKKGN